MPKKEESKFDRVKTGGSSKDRIEKFMKAELPKISEAAYKMPGTISRIGVAGKATKGFIGRLMDKIAHKRMLSKRAKMMKDVPSKETRVARKDVETSRKLDEIIDEGGKKDFGRKQFATVRKPGMKVHEGELIDRITVKNINKARKRAQKDIETKKAGKYTSER